MQAEGDPGKEKEDAEGEWEKVRPLEEVQDGGNIRGSHLVHVVCIGRWCVHVNGSSRRWHLYLSVLSLLLTFCVSICFIQL